MHSLSCFSFTLGSVFGQHLVPFTRCPIIWIVTTFEFLCSFGMKRPFSQEEKAEEYDANFEIKSSWPVWYFSHLIKFPDTCAFSCTTGWPSGPVLTWLWVASNEDVPLPEPEVVHELIHEVLCHTGQTQQPCPLVLVHTIDGGVQGVPLTAGSRKAGHLLSSLKAACA